MFRIGIDMFRRRPARRPRRLLRKKRMLRRRLNLRRRNNAQYATSIETQPLSAFIAGVTPTYNFQSSAINTSGPVYNQTAVLLSNFARSATIAQAYQYYKVKYIEVKLTPQADTFTAGGAYGVPTLYYMVNKGLSIPPNTTSFGLKAIGAKPIRLDDKTITIRYKPGVQLDTAIVTSGGPVQQYNKPIISPWLNTNGIFDAVNFATSQVAHNGLMFFAENAGTAVNFNGQITCHFAFKRPNVPSPSG